MPDKFCTRYLVVIRAMKYFFSSYIFALFSTSTANERAQIGMRMWNKKLKIEVKSCWISFGVLNNILKIFYLKFVHDIHS